MSRHGPVPTVVAQVPIGPWSADHDIRPVTEIQSSVSVAVDYLADYRAEQVFVDAALALQPARCAVGAVQPWWIWLEANQRSAISTPLRPFVSPAAARPSHCGIGDRSAKRPPAHAAFIAAHVGSSITTWPP